MLRNFGSERGELSGFRAIEIVDDHGKSGRDQAPRDP
jgi:hypothetical protein